jgi:hypothetical protein
MTLGLTWLVGLLTTTAAASIGAFVSGRLGLIQADRAETTRLRLETAEELITSLSELRRLLRDAEGSRNLETWSRAVEFTFEAVDDARHRLPPGWRHLKHSLRAALGEAVGGVAYIDLHSASDQAELAAYNYRWTEYAMEYTDLVVDSVRRWRDVRANGAPKVALASFDKWLAETGRYVAGGVSNSD